jgi:hypothetical protein
MTSMPALGVGPIPWNNDSLVYVGCR